MAESAGAKPKPAEKLGYIGLGLMGAPMTRRLLAAGYEVAIWNRSSAKATALVDAGARRANSPRDVLMRPRSKT
jgi:3-hydroxyisobutyrate dehydrogenase